MPFQLFPHFCINIKQNKDSRIESRVTALHIFPSYKSGMVPCSFHPILPFYRNGSFMTFSIYYLLLFVLGSVNHRDP